MVAQIPTPAMIRSNQKVVSHGPRVLQHPFSHIRHHRFELEAEEVAGDLRNARRTVSENAMPWLR